MNQKDVTRIGESLIRGFDELNDDNEAQIYFDSLMYNALQEGANESMPMGWVAKAINEKALKRGIKLLILAGEQSVYLTDGGLAQADGSTQSPAISR
jgi:hypothetical protein